MNLVLTTAGNAALLGGTPPVLTAFKLGSAVNYTPTVSDTDIHGSLVNTGAPSLATVVSPNLLRYTIVVDATAGPFNFGEVGLYTSGNTLFALGAFSTAQHKEPSSNTVVGGNLKIDCYITVVGNSYAVLSDIANALGNVSLPVLSSIDALPSPSDTDYNAYVCLTNIDQYVTTLATAEGNFWSFTGYESVRVTAAVTSASNGYINTGTDCGSVLYAGEIILQFVTGAHRGICRNITAITLSGTRINFSVPLLDVPEVGSTFIIYQRRLINPTLTSLLSGLSPTLSAADLNQLDNILLADLIRKDGTSTMTGSLNLGNNRLVNVGMPVNSSDAATKQFVENILASLSGSVGINTDDIAYLNANAVLRNGAKSMQAPLNMAGYTIRNLALPTLDNDAATVLWTNNQIQAYLNGFSPLHNNLSGLQGGAAGQMYHVTSAERAILTGIVNSGFPISSTTGAGLIEIADTTEVGSATSNAHAVSPSNLAATLNAVGSPTNMQRAIAAGFRVPLIEIHLVAATAAHPSSANLFSSWDYVDYDADNIGGFSPVGAKSAFAFVSLPWPGYYEAKLSLLYSVNSSGSVASSSFAIRNQTLSTDTISFAEGVIQNGIQGSTSGSIIFSVPSSSQVALLIAATSGTVPTIRGGTMLSFRWVRPL